MNAIQTKPSLLIMQLQLRIKINIENKKTRLLLLLLLFGYTTVLKLTEFIKHMNQNHLCWVGLKLFSNQPTYCKPIQPI